MGNVPMAIRLSFFRPDNRLYKLGEHLECFTWSPIHFGVPVEYGGVRNTKFAGVEQRAGSKVGRGRGLSQRIPSELRRGTV